jgi:hypothetical protein
MRNRFKRKRVPESPTVRQTRIGGVQIHSGTLLLADPFTLDGLRITGIPSQRVPVVAQLIRYPEGGQRVAKIGLRFRPGQVESRQTLGAIGVDSAKVVLLDARTYDQCWEDVGPERLGRTMDRQVAKRIETKFGLKSRRSAPYWEFVESISAELEARITAYLKTFPEYAQHTFIYFRIETKNTCTRISEALRERLWAEMMLDENSGANLLAVSSGFGDGQYSIEGLYGSGELLGAEVEFIGPAQDAILEAFPILRY